MAAHLAAALVAVGAVGRRRSVPGVVPAEGEQEGGRS